MHHRSPRRCITDINLRYAAQSPRHLHAVDVSSSTGAAADKRANFSANYWHFARHPGGLGISDALNEHRGIMRSSAPLCKALRVPRAGALRYIFRTRRGAASIVFRIRPQFITRDCWFTIRKRFKRNGSNALSLLICMYNDMSLSQIATSKFEHFE